MPGSPIQNSMFEKSTGYIQDFAQDQKVGQAKEVEPQDVGGNVN